MGRGFVDDLRPFDVPAQQLDNGIEPASSNVSDSFFFGDDIQNIHKSQEDGFGPRYGMAPLPYHSAPTVIAPTVVSQPSLVDLERSPGFGGDGRLKIFGVLPVKLAAYSSTGPLGLPKTHYFWVTTGTFSASIGAVESIGVVTNINGGTDPQPYVPFLDSRLSEFTGISFLSESSFFQFLPLFIGLTGSTQPAGKRALNTWEKYYSSNVSVTVPGRVIKMPWLLGFVNVDTSGSTPPLVEFDFGYTSELSYLNQVSNNRSIRVFRIESTGGKQVTRTQYNASTLPGYYLFRNSFDKNTPDINSARVSFSSSLTYGAAGVYSNAGLAIYNDPQAMHNQRHSIIACAFGRAYGFLLKEELCSSSVSFGTLPIMPLDFTNIAYFPRDFATLNQNTVLQYRENGAAKNTCWKYWPSWSAGTATANDAALACSDSNNNVALGAAQSGILRSNTTYEVTFSVYNKAIGHETNVGTPAKIQTGADDFVSLMLRRSQTATGISTGANNAIVARSNLVPIPIPGEIIANSPSTDRFLNYFEYRVYYRELGSFEWLPAGKIDATDYFYNATERTWSVCTGGIAALPGGQPGGFIDNSFLADDAYFQTFTFSKRLFWVSPKSIAFSGIDAPLVYSVQNAFGCPSGDFLGCIVHAYPGQAEQGARIVVFTTEQTFTARFRGQEFAIQQPVRVSPDTVGTFPLDGSDFDIQPWTSITAFSYRSAVNADGVLFWWGPQGLFRDDGVDVPSKTWSSYLDPILKNLYDRKKVDQIHGIYNSRTHECIWFFLDTDGGQRALVYNTKADSFFLWEFSNILIDASQILDVNLQEGISTRNAIQGSRLLLHCRDAVDTSTPQRTVFFDELVDAGDLRISKVYMVTRVNISGDNRRLLIAPGFSGSLPTSGKLTVSSAEMYGGFQITLGGQPAPVDGIYTIAGGDGSTYIDIAPIGGSWNNDFIIGVDAEQAFWFPVWVESVHGFPLRGKSQYWAPGGFRFWGRWLYCEQMFKVDNLLRNDGFQVKMEWLSTAGSNTPTTRTLTISDNYRGNYRVNSQIPFSQENNVGQGLSTTWTTPSGLHNGGRWYIQYLSYLVKPDTEGNNRRYEG